MENNQDYVEEIDIKNLLYTVLRSWRTFVIIGIIFAILFGAYSGIPSLLTMNDNEALTKNKLEYAEKLKDYESSLEQLNNEISNINLEIESKKEYVENSVLMQTNPYDEIISSIDYYISADAHNLNILNYYVNFVKSSELYNEIINNADLDLEPKYLKEILAVNADYESNMLSITLRHWDNDVSKRIMESVKKLLNEKNREINDNIVNHVYQLINESSMYTIDVDLEKKKIDMQDNIEGLKIKLESKESMIKELNKPEPIVYSYRGAIKNTIKYMLLGSVLGIFLGAGYILFIYLISGRLNDKSMLRKSFQLNLLGDFSHSKEGRVLGFIDRWIDKGFGYQNNNISDEEKIEIIKSNLSLIFDDCKKQKIIITGSIEENELQKIVNDIIKRLKSSNLEIIMGANISKTATTITGAAVADGVILIEKYNKSLISDISREVATLNQIGAKIIGLILL